MVIYRQLLQDADAFGQGETLSGAVGTLTLTDSERESGYSISSLFVKYRTQLVGYYWAEVFGKEFPLQFSFNQMDDAASIRAELVDENGFHYSSDVQTIRVDGAQTLDLTGAESELTLLPGELVLVPAACKGVTLKGHCLVKSTKCVSEK